MNPEAQRIAIAEACGWTECHPATKTPHGFFEAYGRKKLPCGSRSSLRLPDYLNDLNDMHGAEMSQVDIEEGRFIALFREYLHTILGHDGSLAIHATAAQRAEAFLRTLGKWEEAP